MASSSFIPINYEPAFQWSYKVIFPQGIGGGEDIAFSIVSATLPKWEVAVLEVHCKNYQATIAGRRNRYQSTIMVRDFVNPDIASLLNAWAHKVIPSLGIMNHPSKYKNDNVEIRILNGRDEAIQRYQLTGCWPSSIEYGQVDYTATDLIQMTMILEFDSIVTKF
jgi:hypothetical protein